MFDALSINSSQYKTTLAGNTSLKADKSFDDFLSLSLSNKKQAQPLDKWIDAGSAENKAITRKKAVEKVVSYLENNYGIDAESRKPTHYLTRQEKQWLKGRYGITDLDSFKDLSANRNSFDPNFFADLVYLGALSPKEVMNMGLVTFPAHTGTVQKADSAEDILGGHNSASVLDQLKAAMEKQSDYINRITEKSQNPRTSQPQDFDYLFFAGQQQNEHQMIYDLILDLFN